MQDVYSANGNSYNLAALNGRRALWSHFFLLTLHTWSTPASLIASEFPGERKAGLKEHMLRCRNSLVLCSVSGRGRPKHFFQVKKQMTASEMQDSPHINIPQALREILFKLLICLGEMKSNSIPSSVGIVKEMPQCFEFLCFKGLFTLINFQSLQKIGGPL